MPKIVDHDLYRKQLLASCAALFAQHGYAGVTMKQIAKAAGVTRVALDQYLRVTAQGYDGLAAGTTSVVRQDAEGRSVTVVTTVTDDCNTGVDAGTTFSLVSPLPQSQLGCGCPNNICCRSVQVDAQWVDGSRPGRPLITDQYYGFVTKSCG